MKFNDINPNICENSAPVDDLIQMASQNRAKNFNISVTSVESKNIHKRDPSAVQMEIKTKKGHFSKTDNVKCTRTGTFIVNT